MLETARDRLGADRVIELDAPDKHIDLAVLLRDENRFWIRAIHSREDPHQHVVAVSTDRLHTIASEYKGRTILWPSCARRTSFPRPRKS